MEMDKEITKAETYNVLDFLRNLDLDTDTKRNLLGCISIMMTESANRATQFATAACMGLDTEDPKFAAFWNNDVAPIATLNTNTVFKDLRKDVLGETDEKDGEYSCKLTP